MKVIRAALAGLLWAIVIAALAMAPGVVSSKVDFVYALF
jgi:hypothetical protein